MAKTLKRKVLIGTLDNREEWVKEISNEIECEYSPLPLANTKESTINDNEETINNYQTIDNYFEDKDFLEKLKERNKQDFIFYEYLLNQDTKVYKNY